VLETVTQDSARMIMTGQEQSAGKTQVDFKAVVCGKVNALFNCASGITVDVESFPQFGVVSLPDPVDASCNYSPPNNYLPGGPGDIVVVRLFYQWPIFVTGFGFNLSCGSGSTRVLTATAAFQNEPY
jgi:Flp pilus assembly protein TadG